MGGFGGSVKSPCISEGVVSQCLCNMQRVLTAWQGRTIPVGWKRFKKHRFGALLLGCSSVWLIRSKTSPLPQLAEDKCEEHRLQIHTNGFQVMLWFSTGSYVRVNSALAAHGHLRIRDNEQTGSEVTETQVKVSYDTVINVIKMIMFISMCLLKIIQLVTVQQLLMFHFWAAEQTPCSTSDLALIRHQPWQQPSPRWVGGALQVVFHRADDGRKRLFMQDLLLDLFIPEIEYKNKIKNQPRSPKTPHQNHDVSWEEASSSRCVGLIAHPEGGNVMWFHTFWTHVNFWHSQTPDFCCLNVNFLKLLDTSWEGKKHPSRTLKPKLTPLTQAVPEMMITGGWERVGEKYCYFPTLIVSLS